MDNKNSPGRYFLVFEPKYESFQYAVYFGKNGDCTVTKINKYSDQIYNSKSIIKKNTLADIDKVTSSIGDLSTFFKTYIDSSIFMLSGNNLHKMFIGYKQDGRIWSLEYILNKREFSFNISLVRGSKIFDYVTIDKMIRLILDSKDNGFLKYVNRECREKRSNLSAFILNCSNRLKEAYLIGESFSDKEELYMTLRDKLTSYKDYREMFLLSEKYVDLLREEKKGLEQIRNRVLPSQTVQLTLFDIDKGKVKSKRFYDE